MASWLQEAAEKADKRLRALPPKMLGPAGLLLMGYFEADCPACKGKGKVTTFKGQTVDLNSLDCTPE